MFYAFLLNMWIMGRITEESLHAKVPKYISEDEFQMIILTPQDGVIPLNKSAEAE